MKRAVLIFCVLYILTLSVPVCAVAVNKKQSDTKELVTLFSENGEESENASQEKAEDETQAEEQTNGEES